MVIATGGLPHVGHFAGGELANTVWDVLAGQCEATGEVLVFDESGGHAPLSCAEFLAAKGARVELVTPDRLPGLEMSDTNLGAHMSELYKAGTTITPNTRLVEVARDGNKLRAVLENTYSEARSERVVDQVIGDYGTVPNADLYELLRPMSRNLGEIDLAALARPGRKPWMAIRTAPSSSIASAMPGPAATSMRRCSMPCACARTCSGTSSVPRHCPILATHRPAME